MSKLLILLICVYLSGCALQTSVISPEVRIRQAAALAKTAGWRERTIHTTRFTLKTYGTPTVKKTNTHTLTIYIEGDGLAWLSEETPSANPTPMALHDKKNAPIAYLARPCQFVLKEEWAGCRQAYWTHSRFSPEVINAMNQAVEQLKNEYHAKQLVLIGYSGGGTVAALIAARRADVKQLITVAAILDTDFWVRQESLTPLYGSLNPAEAWKSLLSIPPATKKPTIRVIPAFDHACCWATDWQP